MRAQWKSLLSTWAFELPALPNQSAKQLTQCDNMKEPLNKISGGVIEVLGVVSHCFNLSWRSSYLYLIVGREAHQLLLWHLPERKVWKQTENFSCSSSQALCLSQNSIDFSANVIDSFEYCWGGGAHRVWLMHAHVCVFVCVWMCLLADGCQLSYSM